jgi:hypothetical protein
MTPRDRTTDDKRRVGAAVNREVDLAAQNRSVLGHRRAVTRARRMALGGCRHIFQTVVNNFHRPSRFHRQQRRMARNHRGIIFFAPESASGLGLHHTDLVGRQIAQCHERFVHVVGALQRTPHRDSVLGSKAAITPLFSM